MPDANIHRPFSLLVTRNFPPLVGGMENVNKRMLEALATKWHVLLSGPTGCSSHAPAAHATSEAHVKPLPRFFLASALRSLWLALRFRPRLVIAGSGLAAPMAWAAARLVGAKFVVYLHGLDIIAPSKIYQWCWLPFIRASDMVLTNSRNTRSLAVAKGIRADRISVLHPGASVPLLDPEADGRFRKRFDLGSRPLLLSVGRLTQRKGLAEFVARSLPAVAARFPDVLLVIIGGEADDALHTRSGSEQNRIMEASRAGGVEENIRFIGRLQADALQDAYQAAQAHIFPVLEQASDVEGFGMVALEAAAHGLRTVAFAVGGVPDAVSDPVSGELIRAGDYSRFANAVAKILADPQTNDRRQAARAFAGTMDWTAFDARLLSLLAVVA